MADRHHPSVRALLLLIPALAAAGVAEAGNTRNILVTHTSTGPGEITIETFSKPDFPGELTPLFQGNAYLAHITIPASSSAASTCSTIVDSLNAQLPGDFSANIHPGIPRALDLVYTGPGAFSMSVTENVPGQIIEEIQSGITPTLTEWGILALSLTLAGSAFVMLRRRRGGLAQRST